jgi:hypothetical protein
MTEEEAKKKWCPMVRHGDSARNRTYNEGAMLQAFACIASDCMMWREDVIGGRGERYGYCGIGGKYD